MPKLVKISDNFSISDAVSGVTTKVKDHVTNMISDATHTSSKMSLLTEAEVTHGGIVNANYGYYKPEKLQASVPTWVTPYGKPVLVHHDKTKDNIGRVLGSQYKSSIPTFVPKIKNSVYDTDFSYRGQGHIQNLLSIGDAVSVEKVLDGRYQTLSVHGDNDAMNCSICGQEWVNDGKCYHRFGDSYENERTGDDEFCYWIAGNFFWDEVSFVNEPADPFAQVINKEVSGETKDQILATYQYRDVTKSDKQVTDMLKRMVKFYVVNDSKGKMVEVNDETDINALYRIYDVRHTPVGIDLKSTEKEPNQVADQKTQETSTVVKVEDQKTTVTTTEAKAAEVTAPATTTAVQDAKIDVKAAEVADVKTVETKTTATVEDAKVVEDKIKIAVADARKPLEDKIIENEKSITALSDEKKSLTDKATELQTTIRDMKMDQILDLKEALGTDSYPTIADRTKAKEAMTARSLQSIEDMIKDLQESFKKHKRPSPANIAIGDAGAKIQSVEDATISVLSKMTPEQLLAMKLTGRINMPVLK